MDATLMWIDAERGGDSRLSWSNLSRYRASQDDIPVILPDFLSYGDYDNSGVEERSNFPLGSSGLPGHRQGQDSVWWEVVGGLRFSRARAPTSADHHEMDGGGCVSVKVSPSTGPCVAVPVQHEQRAGGGAVGCPDPSAALIDRMWSVKVPPPGTSRATSGTTPPVSWRPWRSTSPTTRTTPHAWRWRCRRRRGRTGPGTSSSGIS